MSIIKVLASKNIVLIITFSEFKYAMKHKLLRIVFQLFLNYTKKFILLRMFWFVRTLSAFEEFDARTFNLYYRMQNSTSATEISMYYVLIQRYL